MTPLPAARPAARRVQFAELMKVHATSLFTRSIKGILVLGSLGLAACSTPLPPVEAPPPSAPVEAPPPPPPAPEPPPPPPAPLALPSPIKFSNGTARLDKESDATLQYVLDYLAQNPKLEHLRVEGHTDDRGGAAANQKLSEDRALSVSRWLVEHGVDCKRLRPLGFGDTLPVADNTTEEGRAQNRRTVFIDHEVAHEGGHSAGDACAK